jgi:hypothetical protein
MPPLTIDPLAQAVNRAASSPSQPNTPSQDEQDKFFSFPESKIHLDRIIADWSDEIAETEKRRKERKVELNLESLRQKNELDEDETIIPVRIIDTNITREQPPYINYLKNSRRIGIFESLDNPDQDNDLLEQDFTKKCTYTGWELPHFKCLDGSQAHGWDSVEVVCDTEKPGHFALEQIGHDKLFFPRSAIDLQQCPRLIRAYDVTILQLRSWITKYGFDSEQVDLILKSRKDTRKENETIRIYKCFYKKDGVVYVAWFCLSDGVSDWLKKPQQHYVGIDEQGPNGQFVPKPLTMYPIFILPYKLTEESKIVDARGRGFLDCYKQEAMTALWSAYINGMNRASSIYASPKQEDGTGSSLKEVEDLKMTPGRFLNKPVDFWSPPYPDALVLRTLQFADVQNSDETNQVNFAAMNREDSRKTAKEIGAAENQQALLNSVQLTLFSIFIRQVYSFVWLIVQSQALQNKIQFLLVQRQVPQTNPYNPQIPMLDQQTQQPMMQTVWSNNTSLISQKYTVRAAGDVDVISKNETIQKMRTDFNLIMTTPLKDVFLLDYIRLVYPEKADRYTQILAQTSQMAQMKSMIGQLSTVTEGLLKDHPESLQQLPQQQQSDLASMIQQAKQISGEPASPTA